MRSLWTSPDPVLAQAGVAGELLVAKVRLGLATLLLTIPVLNSIFFSVEMKEQWVVDAHFATGHDGHGVGAVRGAGVAQPAAAAVGDERSTGLFNRG